MVLHSNIGGVVTRGFSRVSLILLVLVHVSLILICCDIFFLQQSCCFFFFLDVSLMHRKHLQFVCFDFSLVHLSERVTQKCRSLICCRRKCVAQCHLFVVLSPCFLLLPKCCRCKKKGVARFTFRLLAQFSVFQTAQNSNVVL